MQKTRPRKELFLTLMKISLLQIFLLTAFVGITYAHRAEGQEVMEQKISFSLEKERIKNILHTIEKAAKVKFTYSPQLIPANQKLSLTVRNETLSQVLDRLLKPLDVSYEVMGRNIVLNRRLTPRSLPAAESGEAQASLDIELPAPIVLQTVSGTVTDEGGNGLPGVSVVVKGTQSGTNTDASGKFRLSVPDAATSLVFSFVGYLTQEVAVGNQTQLNISMQADTKSLDEVVVIGYGSQKKRDLTGSVSSVTSRDIERVPVLGLDQALQGRASGVFVSNNNANPGGAVNIRVRGTNSIQGNNEPLYVIDGYIGGNINAINPTDIASIEVLKDASSTAIYGARGANGVVIVTTKMGGKGKSNLSFDTFTGFQKIIKKVDMMGARDYANFVNELNIDQGNDPTFANPNNPDYDTNWQDEILRTAPWSQHSLSASGGTGKVNYYVSGAYINQKGIVKETNYDRFNIRANVDANVTDNIKFGTRLGFSRIDRTQQSGEEIGRNDDTGHPVARSLTLPPTNSPRDADGNLLATVDDALGTPRGNPLNDLRNIYQKVYSVNFTGNLYAELKFLKYLKFRTTFGFNVVNEKQNRYKPSTVYETTTAFQNSASVNTKFNIGWLNENYFTYQQQFGQHGLEATAGMTLQGNDFEGLNVSVSDFAVDDFLYHNISAGSIVGAYNTDMSQWRQASAFGRIHYTLKDKYLFTFNGRYDGSSKFGKDNKWAFFPSGAIAWRIGDEGFIKNLGVFSDAKLRASYGISGSEALGPYNSLSAMESASTAYLVGDAPVVGYYPSRLPNPFLRWEQTAQLDIGLDFAVMKGRIDFVLDYFDKKTRDLFLNKPVPQTSGVRSVKQNIGSLRNSGFELGVNAVVIDRKLTWRTSMNGTYQTSKILNLGAEDAIITGHLSGGYNISATQIMQVGQPLGTFFGYKTNGTWSTDDAPDAYTQFGSKVKAGDIKLVDVNGDGDVNADDRSIIGYGQPKFYGGFNNSLTYKNFDLSVFFQFVAGTNVFNAMSTNIRNTGQPGNKHIELNNAWRPENQDTDIPRAGSIIPREVLDRYVEDGSFVRLRELSLGYSLPTDWLQRVKISRLRLYVSGTNLLTFSKYTGYDPEVNIAAGDINILNLDNGSYPRARTLIFGLNLTF